MFVLQFRFIPFISLFLYKSPCNLPTKNKSVSGLHCSQYEIKAKRINLLSSRLFPTSSCTQSAFAFSHRLLYFVFSSRRILDSPRFSILGQHIPFSRNNVIRERHDLSDMYPNLRLISFASRLYSLSLVYNKPEYSLVLTQLRPLKPPFAPFRC